MSASFVTAALDVGVPAEDANEDESHADASDDDDDDDDDAADDAYRSRFASSGEIVTVVVVVVVVIVSTVVVSRTGFETVPCPITARGKATTRDVRNRVPVPPVAAGTTGLQHLVLSRI
tara:strand:- start:1810 stop:2166 length:357 start_codon:yes stop_codon:yes gene_type:complete